MFVVKEKLNCDLNKLFCECSATLHYFERVSRANAYKDLGLLSNNIIAGFVVDTGHINGPEIHLINDKGLIYVLNQRTRKLITILAARPKQIKRYYDATAIVYPSKINDLIRDSYDYIIKVNANNW